MNTLKLFGFVGFITMLSRIFGFIRDRIIAQIFGLGIETDAFFVALKIPNSLRKVFAEGAFTQSFVPILEEYKYKKNIKDIKIFISYVFGFLLLILIFITFFFVFFSKNIIIFIAPGFRKVYKKFFLSVYFFKVLIFYLILVSLNNFFGLILNSWENIIISAFSQILLNIGVIVFILLGFFFPLLSTYILVFSIIFGGFLQLLYQMFFLKRINMLIIPNINLYHFGLFKFLKSYGKSLIGVFFTQISLIINTIFSSFLESGSVSWIYYSDRLIEFPSGIIGGSLATILLSSLSKKIYNSNYQEYYKLIDWWLRLCFLLIFPSVIILYFTSKLLIITLFQYGKFSNFDVLMTQKSVIIYSYGLFGIILAKILSVIFYSQQNVFIPVITSIISSCFSQIINFFCINSMKHTVFPFSIGISSYLNVFLLVFCLYYRKIFFLQRGWFLFLIRLFISSIFMSISIKKICSYSFNIIQYSMMFRLVYLFCVIFFGISTYCIVLYILGFRFKRFS